MEEAEILNAFFASVFTGLQESRVPETQGKVWSKEGVPLVEEDQVREYLSKADIHELMVLDGMHPRAEGAGRCHCKAAPHNL